MVINLPDGQTPSEVYDPSSQSISQVLDPDGNIVWSAEQDVDAGKLTVESFESGDYSGWDSSGSMTVDTGQAFDGSYGMYGHSGSGSNYIFDDGTNYLNHIYSPGDKIRAFWYVPRASSNVSANCRARLNYGGSWNNSYFIQWDIQNSNMRLWDGSDTSTIASTFSSGVPGAGWYALEGEWIDNGDGTYEHIWRVMDYRDSENPTQLDSLSVQDSRYTSGEAFYWYVWISDNFQLYTDYLHYYDERVSHPDRTNHYADLLDAGDYIDLSSGSVTVNPGQTFLMWVQATSIGTDHAQAPGLFAGSSGGGWDDFFCFRNDDGSSPQTSGTVNAQVVGEPSSGTWMASENFTYDLDANPWMLLGFTYHSDGTVTFWKDGSTLPTRSELGTSSTFNINYIGPGYAGAGNDGTGNTNYDAPVVYDRELTGVEVDNLWSTGEIPNDPLHYWPFDGQNLEDRAGGVDGTGTGVTYSNSGYPTFQ